MKNISSAVLLVIAFFLSACKKGELTNGPTGKNYLLSMDITKTDTTIYTYDAANRLISMRNTGVKTEYKFTYDTSDKLTESNLYSNGKLSSKFTLNYTANSPVASSTLYNTSGAITFTGSATLTLNSKGQVTKYDNGGNNYYLFEYDQAGNITKDTYYSSQSLTIPRTIYTYGFGTKHSPLLNAKGYFQLIYIVPFYFLNEVTSRSTIDNSTNPATVTSITSTYEYNADDYPTTMSVNSAGVNYPNAHTYVYVNQ